MEEKKDPNTQKPVKKAANSKIKVSIVALLIVSTFIVMFSFVYFKYLLPVLNFIYNQAEDGPGGSNVTIGKEDLLNENDPYYKRPVATPENTADPNVTPTPTADPNVTPDPNETPAPTPDPNETPTQEPEDFTIDEAEFVHASEVVFEKGTRNVLVLGFDEKGTNSDSIFIININETTKHIKIISVPRDTYVPHSEKTKQALKDRNLYYSPGMHKLNAVVYIGKYVIKYVDGIFGNSGIDYMCAILSSLFPGCEIDDYVYVNFYGFMDLIDVVGGVYVTSPENMYTETGELKIKEGLNKLNARDTLFYVRYRKRLDSQGHDTYTGSDNWRKINQANFIAEIMPQIITKENMNLDKIVDTLEVLKKSVYHSFNTIPKINYYINIGREFANKQYTVSSYVIKGYTIDPFGDKAGYSQLD